MRRFHADAITIVAVLIAGLGSIALGQQEPTHAQHLRATCTMADQSQP